MLREKDREGSGFVYMCRRMYVCVYAIDVLKFTFAANFGILGISGAQYSREESERFFFVPLLHRILRGFLVSLFRHLLSFFCLPWRAITPPFFFHFYVVTLLRLSIAPIFALLPILFFIYSSLFFFLLKNGTDYGGSFL